MSYLGLRERIAQDYQQLYRDLKSKVAEALDQLRVPPSLRGEITDYVSSLPHPSVASLRDIRDVCQACISGLLETLYPLFGQQAHAILNTIEGHYSSEYTMEVTPPPKTKTYYTMNDIGQMLGWTNESLFALYKIVSGVRSQTDIILKGQCPFCHGYLVTAIVNAELRLRCKNPGTTRCRTTDWYVGNVVAKPRP